MNTSELTAAFFQNPIRNHSSRPLLVYPLVSLPLLVLKRRNCGGKMMIHTFLRMIVRCRFGPVQASGSPSGYTAIRAIRLPQRRQSERSHAQSSNRCRSIRQYLPEHRWLVCLSVADLVNFFMFVLSLFVPFIIAIFSYFLKICFLLLSLILP